MEVPIIQADISDIKRSYKGIECIELIKYGEDEIEFKLDGFNKNYYITFLGSYKSNIANKGECELIINELYTKITETLIEQQTKMLEDEISKIPTSKDKNKSKRIIRYIICEIAMQKQTRGIFELSLPKELSDFIDWSLDYKPHNNYELEFDEILRLIRKNLGKDEPDDKIYLNNIRKKLFGIIDKFENIEDAFTLIGQVITNNLKENQQLKYK